MRRSTVLPAVAALSLVAVLGACSGSDSSGAGAGSAPRVKTKIGVTVVGETGKKPTLEIPSTAAPDKTSVEVLSPGTGATIRKGDVLKADYLGQTWAPKDGKPNVFDNSYDRGEPTGFQLGVGKVVKGWDSTLVGQKLGSRVIVAVPPADGYGPTASAQAPLGGQTLVFVVDLRSVLKGDGVATGAVEKAPAGYPQLETVSGKRPAVTGVQGLKPGKEPKSALLIKGTGEPIADSKQLMLQYLQTDAKTGKKTQATWTTGYPDTVPADQVLSLVPALKGQPIGSRAVLVTPSVQGQEAAIVVVDVIGQF